MGKPYEIELSKLTDTYRWALNAPINQLKDFVGVLVGHPLICVGSGGSLTTACAAAMLHENSGDIARASTPLELLALDNAIRRSGVLLLTAGGGNPDILNAFRVITKSEPRSLLALCARTKSPLSTLVSESRFARLYDFDMPSGKDGFLATNSLLASIVLLIRSYNEVISRDWFMPAGLIAESESDRWLHDNATVKLLGRATLVVLHGYWGSMAAVDAESKFTESSLGNLQTADYRNFAHGRHHWLAKRTGESGVIALITPDDERIAERTLALIPREVPVLRLHTQHQEAVGGLDLLVKVMRLVGQAGRVHAIDPGRPGVPEFGRRIYNLPMAGVGTRSSIAAGDAVTHILRKSINATRLTDDIWGRWKVAYNDFLARLGRERFGCVVFDYDGTLIGGEDRFNSVSQEIARSLLALLKGGITVGIATGRGQSVRHDMQSAIPMKFWGQVLVGYYNGACIAPLTDNTCPDKTSKMDAALEGVKQRLEEHLFFSKIASCDYRPKQITVEPLSVSSRDETRRILVDVVRTSNVCCVQVLESSHSIDVVAAGVSKRNVVTACEKFAGSLEKPSVALCIGDSGAYPGNDYELLATPLSLSVDAVSSDAGSCWNLAPIGIRGVPTTEWYLKRLKIERGAVRYRPDRTQKDESNRR